MTAHSFCLDACHILALEKIDSLTLKVTRGQKVTKKGSCLKFSTCYKQKLTTSLSNAVVP